MTVGDNSAQAVALFDEFVQAKTCQAILSSFQQLCDCLEIDPLDDGWFYNTLKGKLTHWKAVSLWNKLDKRFSHKEYNNHTACANTGVLVIGAGPCGLRSAIESKLLGARVVVIEKRDRFSRNNVLHLWPFVIHDLKSLGAKVFYPKFCAGSIDHISIRQLQCVLMKISLLLGVEIYVNVGYEDLIPPSTPDTPEADKKGWRAQTSPADHPVSCYEFDVIIGADGKRNTLQGFKRKEFRGKLAIAITVNFINGKTTEEGRVEEISGVAFIFNQKFFKDLYAQTGIDLENIVYYKDDTHYFVMTAKKQSLLQKGVLIKDYSDTIKLLSRDNVNQKALQNYSREAADVSTNHKLPNLQFAHNHFGQPDIAMFDFTSLFAADNSSRVIERYGRKLLINVVGDSLLEPFWPTGSGCARGFLGCFDAAWATRSWASGRVSPLQVLAERESVYMLLSQTTPESMSKSFNNYTINPKTRYKHCNTQALKPIQVRHLYDTTEKINIEELEPVAIPAKKARTYDIILDYNRLLRWCNKKLALLPKEVRCMASDLTGDWKDGRKFYLLLHLYSPESLPMDQISKLSDMERLTQAFNTAEKQYGILPMLTPGEICSAKEPDKLFMVSYISQYYSTLKDRRTAGASVEFLVPPSNGGTLKHKPAVSPGSSGKMSTLRKFGKIIGTGGRSNRRRKSSAQKSPRDRLGSREGELKSPSGPKSPKYLHSPSHGTLKKSKGGPKSPRHGPTSPKHTSKKESKAKQGKISAEAFDIFNKSEEPQKQDQQQKAPGTDNVRNRMKEIRDAFSLKSKRKSMQPAQKKKAALRDDWMAGKYDKLEEIDVRMRETSWRMEPGNIGNTNPGKRGSNLVSQVASIFSQSTPEPSPIVKRRAAEPSEEPSGLDVILNREPNKNEICFFCKKRIYLVERQSAEGMFFHRRCFRCYYCDASLHVGSYTLHRSSLGQARFYCNQHVGKERQSLKRGLDTADSSTTANSRPDSIMFETPSASNSNHDQLASKFATPERIEFESSMDLADEESEEAQTLHNLGGRPSTEQTNWEDYESDSDDDDDMEVDDEDGGDDSDMEETTLPSIDDVLDTETWRRKQRLHKQQSNGSHTTLTSSTATTSDDQTSLTRSVTPPAKPQRAPGFPTEALKQELQPAANQQPAQPVSILKQPISIKADSANQKPAQQMSSSSRASAWSQQQRKVQISPTSSVQEINRRKSNFFAQAAEPIRLDVKSVLDPHPAASPAGTLSAVPISLGDTLRFKKDKDKPSADSSSDEEYDNNTDELSVTSARLSTKGDVVTSDSKNLTDYEPTNMMDTMRRKHTDKTERSRKNELKVREGTPESKRKSKQTRGSAYENVELDEVPNGSRKSVLGVPEGTPEWKRKSQQSRRSAYENVELEDVSDDFVTKRKPKTPSSVMKPLYVDTSLVGYDSPPEDAVSDHDQNSESDIDDSDIGSGYSTISTPSDDEIENMSPIGTLRHDGTLAPPTVRFGDEAEQAPPSSSSSSNQICDTGQTPPTSSFNVNKQKQAPSSASQYENVVLKTDKPNSNDQISSSSSNQKSNAQTPAANPESTQPKSTEESGDKFYTPLLRFKPNSKKGHITTRKKRAGTKHRISPTKTSPPSAAGKKPAITNPTYEHFTFDHTVSGINVSPAQRSGGSSAANEESIYETPCALGSGKSPNFPSSAAGSASPGQRKILTLDKSLTKITFDSSSDSEDDVPELNKLPRKVIPSRPVSNIELDGSFHKMCLTEPEPTLASGVLDEPDLAVNVIDDDDDLFVTEEELTSSEEYESESESDESEDEYTEQPTPAGVHYNTMPATPGSRKLSPEKIQSAAARQQKREEMKRLRMAQEIQRQLQEVEVKTKALENEGVDLEKSLRRHADPSSEFDGDKNKELMQRWFNVIHSKSQLFRYESELMVRAKELELEDRHARLTSQLRSKMLTPESEKSHEESTDEKRLIEELLEVVEQRDELVQMLETERLKEREEDEQLQSVMTQKGFELSPLPYTQVTLKKAYNGRNRRLVST